MAFFLSHRLDEDDDDDDLEEEHVTKVRSEGYLAVLLKREHGKTALRFSYTYGVRRHKGIRI